MQNYVILFKKRRKTITFVFRQALYRTENVFYLHDTIINNQLLLLQEKVDKLNKQLEPDEVEEEYLK